MAATPSFPMPFASVPCSIWLARTSEADAYGNEAVEYPDEPDIETVCVYSMGWTQDDGTSPRIEDGRPYGVRSEMSFFLKKDVDADLRRARIAAYPADDQQVYGRVWTVMDEPQSKMRANTPGDYSWLVRAAATDG